MKKATSRKRGVKKSAAFDLTRRVKNNEFAQDKEGGQNEGGIINRRTVLGSEDQNLTPIIITPMQKKSVTKIAKESMENDEPEKNKMKIGAFIKRSFSSIGIKRVAKILIIVVIISLLMGYQKQWFGLGGVEKNRKNQILIACAIGGALLVVL